MKYLIMKNVSFYIYRLPSQNHKELDSFCSHFNRVLQCQRIAGQYVQLLLVSSVLILPNGTQVIRIIQLVYK